MNRPAEIADAANRELDHKDGIRIALTVEVKSVS